MVLCRHSNKVHTVKTVQLYEGEVKAKVAERGNGITWPSQHYPTKKQQVSVAIKKYKYKYLHICTNPSFFMLWRTMDLWWSQKYYGHFFPCQAWVASVSNWEQENTAKLVMCFRADGCIAVPELMSAKQCFLTSYNDHFSLIIGGSIYGVLCVVLIFWHAWQCFLPHKVRTLHNQNEWLL